jgi:uncharacterized glyoxalase superfamily protein PhnB
MWPTRFVASRREAPGRATRAQAASTAGAFSKLLTPRFETMTSTEAAGRSSGGRVARHRLHVVQAERVHLTPEPLHARDPRVHGDDACAGSCSLGQLHREEARARAHVEDRGSRAQRHAVQEQESEGRRPQGQLVVEIREARRIQVDVREQVDVHGPSGSGSDFDGVCNGRVASAEEVCVMAETKASGLKLKQVTVSLTVDDLAKSIAWYEGALGFSQGERFEENGVLMGIEMKAGEVRLFLGQDDWKKGKGRKKGDGWRAYYLTDGDVDAVAERAGKFGAKLDDEPRDTEWASREFSLTDPDGFKITIGKER